MFGRCELLNVEKAIGELLGTTEYQNFSINYLLSDLIGAEYQINLAKDVFFVVNSISLFIGKEPINNLETGILEDLAFALLNGFGITIKVIKKDHKTIAPISNLPLDTLISPKGYPSLTHPELFSLLDNFGTGLILSPDEVNYVSVQQIVPDLYTDIVVPMFPDYDDDTRRALLEKALNYLKNNIYLSLNGFYSKEILPFLEVKDEIDVKAKRARVAYSKDLTPNFRINVYSDVKDETRAVAFNQVVNESWTPSVVIRDRHIEGWKDKPIKERISYPNVPLPYYTIEVILPQYHQPVLIKKLEVVFTTIPELLILGGRKDKLLVNPIAISDEDKNWHYGYVKDTNDNVIRYDVIDNRFSCSEILTEKDGSGCMIPLDKDFVNCNSGDLQLFRGSTVVPSIYRRLQATRIFAGEVSYSQDGRNWKVLAPVVGKLIGDDKAVSFNLLDIMVSSLLQWDNPIPDHMYNRDTGEHTGHIVEGNKEDLFYWNFNDNDDFSQVPSFAAIYGWDRKKILGIQDNSKDVYITPFGSIKFSKMIMSGNTALKEENFSTGYFMLIEPLVKVKVKIKIPYYFPVGQSRLYYNAFILEE